MSADQKVRPGAWRDGGAARLHQFGKRGEHRAGQSRQNDAAWASVAFWTREFVER